MQLHRRAPTGIILLVLCLSIRTSSSEETRKALLKNNNSISLNPIIPPVSNLGEYPVDPYRIKVPRTTTSLIFSNYGSPIQSQIFLQLIARAQYQIIRAIIAAHGDAPVPQPLLVWSERRLCLHIGRPPGGRDLTWQMVANTLEGLRIFFDRLQGWFETSVTILDDMVGAVGDGSLIYGDAC